MTQVQNAMGVPRKVGLELVNGEGIWAEGTAHRSATHELFSMLC